MDFSVRTTNVMSAESRGWLRGMHGTDPGSNPSVTLDLSLFPAALYPNGYVPSGTVVAQVTASGLYGPYDNSATDGRQTAQGLLFDSENVAAGQTRAVNAILRHGNVDETRLPFKTGAGAVDAAAKADLPLIDWK